MKRILRHGRERTTGLLERLGRWFATPAASVSAFECRDCGAMSDVARSGCPDCGGPLEEVRWYYTGDYW